MSDPRGSAFAVGFILAAGYGSRGWRHSPITYPSPCLPVGGETLLDRAAAALTAAGCETIGVNTHHLAPMISDHLARQERADADFLIFYEPEILGTGGALHGARALLSSAPSDFLLHNGDVICGADLAQLMDEHRRTGALATLLLVDHPAINSVAVDGAGAVRRIGGDGGGDDAAWERLTYTGIGIFRRELLQDIGPGFSSLIDPLVRAKDGRPGSVRGVTQESLNWSDLGTPARYLAALPEAPASAAAGMRVEAITGHGSDRRFWRLAVRGHSLVAMVSHPSDEEFERYVQVARWLHREDLGGPRILAANPDEKSALMEDLGDDSLLNRAARGQDLEESYRQVLRHLLALQAHTQRARISCPWLWTAPWMKKCCAGKRITSASVSWWGTAAWRRTPWPRWSPSSTNYPGWWRPNPWFCCTAISSLRTSISRMAGCAWWTCRACAWVPWATTP
jgi:MurNAc alpha-1-phosphate uridylyltransferase